MAKLNLSIPRCLMLWDGGSPSIQLPLLHAIRACVAQPEWLAVTYGTGLADRVVEGVIGWPDSGTLRSLTLDLAASVSTGALRYLEHLSSLSRLTLRFPHCTLPAEPALEPWPLAGLAHLTVKLPMGLEPVDHVAPAVIRGLAASGSCTTLRSLSLSGSALEEREVAVPLRALTALTTLTYVVANDSCYPTLRKEESAGEQGEMVQWLSRRLPALHVVTALCW